MTTLRLRRGQCLVSVDPDVTEERGIIRPGPGFYDKCKTGFVHLHEYTSRWLQSGEADLTGQRVVFDRWSGRPIKIAFEGWEKHEFLTLSQWAILAVLDQRWCECGSLAYLHDGSNAIYCDNPNCQRMRIAK